MAKGRNPYRPGTASYARYREASLKRTAALPRVNAARAKTPETRRRAKQRATSAQRALRAIETREEYRSKLNEHDRAAFNRLPIMMQEEEVEFQRDYPEEFPKTFRTLLSVDNVVSVGGCITLPGLVCAQGAQRK